MRTQVVLAGGGHAHLLDVSQAEAYRPQEKFLIILNMGDGTGLAIRGGWHWHGRLAMKLKHFIDRRFMKRYQR